MLGRKRARKEQQQESSKKQRMEEDKESDEVEAFDGSSKRFSSMIRMLQDIDREDLLTLWKLVKTKHGDIRPEDEHDRVMWGDFKVMFEPDIKSKVWRDLQGLKCSTSNSGSKPTGNKKNDRILQTLSRNMKNKVEAQPRKVNKKNRVVKPIRDADVSIITD
ncbi:hypothetical protein Tco_0077264 [Tanacetum coccineum]